MERALASRCSEQASTSGRACAGSKRLAPTRCPGKHARLVVTGATKQGDQPPKIGGVWRETVPQVAVPPVVVGARTQATPILSAERVSATLPTAQLDRRQVDFPPQI